MASMGHHHQDEVAPPREVQLLFCRLEVAVIAAVVVGVVATMIEDIEVDLVVEIAGVITCAEGILEDDGKEAEATIEVMTDTATVDGVVAADTAVVAAGIGEDNQTAYDSFLGLHDTRFEENRFLLSRTL